MFMFILHIYFNNNNEVHESRLAVFFWVTTIWRSFQHLIDDNLESSDPKAQPSFIKLKSPQSCRKQQLLNPVLIATKDPYFQTLTF